MSQNGMESSASIGTRMESRRSVHHVGRGDGDLRCVELGEGERGIGVDDGLHVEPAHALERAHVERVLAQEITRIERLHVPFGELGVVLL